MTFSRIQKMVIRQKTSIREGMATCQIDAISAYLTFCELHLQHPCTVEYYPVHLLAFSRMGYSHVHEHAIAHKKQWTKCVTQIQEAFPYFSNLDSGFHNHVV